MLNKHIKKICLSPGTLGKGGIGRNTLNLAKEFKRMGFEVDIIFTGTSHFGREIEIPRGINVLQIANRSRYALPAAIRYLQQRKPDLIISARNNINVLMLVAHRLSGLKMNCFVVCTFRTVRSFQQKNSNLQDRFYDWLGFRIYHWADKLVAVSKSVAYDIESNSRFKSGEIEVIYNPGWSDEMLKKASEPCNDKWILDKTGPLLVSAGRLTKAKDYPTLLKAFSIFLVKNDTARLLILGEGEERKTIEDKIIELKLSNNVRLAGHVINPLAYFSKADLFVLSSEWEGFGNVIVEALGCGLPVVATDCPGGVSEILDYGKFGKLVPVKNPEKLAEEMVQTLNYPPSPNQLKKRAMEFSFSRCASEYLSLFERV